MNVHADKTPENKRQSVANTVSDKSNANETAFQFRDNRSETAVQRKMYGLVNNSLQNNSVPMQRKVYFTDEDGAQATENKPNTYPHWESPLNGTDQSLHNTADGASDATVTALNVGNFTKISEEPTKYSGGGEPANGNYEFWLDEESYQVKGHPTHTEDTTNTLTKITKAGKKEKRGNSISPVIHDHAADYGVVAEPYGLLANPGIKYEKAEGAMDHYLQKPE